MKLKLYPTALFKNRTTDKFSNCGYTTHTFWKSSMERFGDVELSTVDMCDAICLFTTYLGGDYVFDIDMAIKIAQLKKPIIIFDYSEYGGHEENHLIQYNLYGFRLEYGDLATGGYGQLHKFITENQSLVKCYFKRELSSILDLSIVPFNVFPLEFIGNEFIPKDKPDTADQFYDRPCLLNFIWGYSNLSRPHLHGKILLNMEKFNCHFALSFRQAREYLKDDKNKFILLVNHDWYERVNNIDLFNMQKKSRMVVDLYGCGLKCFRNTESSVDCISIKQDPTKLVYTYNWKDGENCIYLPTQIKSNIIDVDKSLDILTSYRHEKQHLLYNIYLNSLEISRLYTPRNYIPNHIIKNIKLSA